MALILNLWYDYIDMALQGIFKKPSGYFDRIEFVSPGCHAGRAYTPRYAVALLCGEIGMAASAFLIDTALTDGLSAEEAAERIEGIYETHVIPPYGS